MKNRKYIWLLLAAALLLAAGCEPEVAVSRIQLPEETYIMAKGDRLLLDTVLLPENAISGLELTWSSDNEEAVTVSDIGLVRAVDVGTAEVTVTASSGATASCTVTVSPLHAENLKLDRTAVTLDRGETDTLTVSFEPGNVIDRTVTWTSSAPDKVSVKDGVITALAHGEAEIKAETANGITASCMVTVNPVEAEGIKLSRTDLIIPLGKEHTLQAEFYPADTTDRTIIWTSDNETSFTVEDGRIKALAEGTAVIKAETSNGLTATCTVTVGPAPVEAIELNTDRLNMMMGSSFDVEVKFIPDYAAEKNFTIVSDDPRIVSIEGSRIRTVAPGRTKVTVTSGEVSAEIPVTVADYFGHNNNDLKAQITEYGTGSEKKLTIAGKLTYSDFQYLAGLTDLETLDLSLLDVYALPQYGLFGAKNIRTVILPEGITEIPYSFFYSSPISSVNIPASVTKIDGYAFGATPQLESVTLPDGLSEIGDYAFWGSGLTSITVPGSVSILGNGIFYECAQLKSAVLSEGVTEIGSNTFYYCKILESIRLPSTLTSIGPSAFQLCGLGGIVIPEKVASIGPLAFYGNMEMRSAELPDGLQRIESQTFASCTKLRKLNLPSDLVYIGPAAFRESPVTPEDGILKIPSGVTEIGDSAFGFLYSMDQDSFKSKITEIQLNEGLTKIGQHAFDNMPNLTKIEFPSSLTTLSDTAIPAWVTDVTFRGTTVPSVSMTYTEAADPIPAAPDTAWMKNVDVHVPASVLDAWKTGEWGSGGYDGYGEKITYFDPAKMTVIPKD